MLRDLQTRCSTTEFNYIMASLQSPSITDHPEYADWTPLSGRLRCFEKLRKHLESIYPISKDEIKIESGSFMSLVLNSITNNPNFNSMQINNSINSNNNSYMNSNTPVSIIKLLNIENKGRKIYNANKNKILIEDDLNKKEKVSKDENEAFLGKSNSSLKAIRNEKISQSLNVNKISDIDQENNNLDTDRQRRLNYENYNEEFSNPLYEIYEANKKNNYAYNNKGKNTTGNNMNINVNEIYSDEKISFNNNNKSNNNYFIDDNKNNYTKNKNSLHLLQNNKYNYYNNDINVIEEEERSKKEDEIDLDDLDENMELDQNNLMQKNSNNFNTNNSGVKYNQGQKHSNDLLNKQNKNSFNNKFDICNKNNLSNNLNKNNNNLNFNDNYNMYSNDLDKLEIIDDDPEMNNNNNQDYDHALSDLDKEEYFMKSCYDFFDYDITTLAERKVIEDSHPIRTSCFSSKGDYFAIGTNSKSIKLFYIKPILHRFNKKNSYNFKYFNG